jgi:hypothetical protein
MIKKGKRERDKTEIKHEREEGEGIGKKIENTINIS